MINKHTDKKKNTTVLYLGKMSGGSWGVKGAPGVIRTTETDKLNVQAIIEKGELDLGFCKIVKKEIRGGKGKSHGTEFKIGKYYKLGVIMSESFKKLLNK